METKFCPKGCFELISETAQFLLYKDRIKFGINASLDPYADLGLCLSLEYANEKKIALYYIIQQEK